VIAESTGEAGRVIACPDADLGGVRIAEQILSVAPHAEVLDIGAYPHDRRRPWKPDSTSAVGLRAACEGPAGELARACTQRGYPVEHELAAGRRAGSAARLSLATPGPRPEERAR
jgi:hypothetical protein